MLENQYAERITLDGIWQIEIGEQHGTLTVPGVWEVQGYTRDVTYAKIERQIDIPASWTGTQVMLSVAAAGYDVTFRVNGQRVGQHIGMWSPFEFDVSDYLRYGETNTISADIIKPSNTGTGTYPYRNVLVGFVPYISSTSGGIWQSINLVSHKNPAWQQVKISSDASQKRVHVLARLEGAAANSQSTVTIYDTAGNNLVTEETGDTTLDLTVSLPEMQPWQPENPRLYTIELKSENAIATRRVGFRQLQAKGHDLYLNDAPIFLRGILSWGWNPETLAPTFSDDFIRDEFRRVREQGFNLYKLCLYVPPENLFRIADEEGMLLWLELPMWWQLDNPHLREQLPAEYAEIIARVHHHPSIILVSLGCEIESHMVGEGLVGQLDEMVRQHMDGILLCENSGSGEAYDGLTVDIADFYDYHFYADAHYFQPMIQHFRRDWRTPRPWIFGEFAAQDDYRNPEKLVDENGQRLWWRDLLGTDGGIHRWAYRDQEKRVEKLDLPFTHDEMETLSRQQSYAFRKIILETVRRHNTMSGYVITGLRDTPITTSGVWDDHLTAKYSNDAMLQINDSDVLLLEQGRRRIWIEGDRPYPRDISNHRAGSQADFYILFSGLQAPDTALKWRLQTLSGEVLVSGKENITIPPLNAKPHQIARIAWTFPEVEEAIACKLHVESGKISNCWNMWIYPQNTDAFQGATCYDPAGTLIDLQHLPTTNLKQPDNSVIITSVLTHDLITALEAGAKVILLQAGNGSIPAKQVAFWQESLNLLLEHPLWDNIPHDGVATEQFYHVATDYAFDPGKTAYQPVMRQLQTRLFTVSDMIIDMSAGQGRLLATTLHLLSGKGDQAGGLQENVLGAYILSEMIRFLRQ